MIIWSEDVFMYHPVYILCPNWNGAKIQIYKIEHNLTKPYIILTQLTNIYLMPTVQISQNTQHSFCNIKVVKNCT